MVFGPSLTFWYPLVYKICPGLAGWGDVSHRVFCTTYILHGICKEVTTLSMWLDGRSYFHLTGWWPPWRGLHHPCGQSWHGGEVQVHRWAHSAAGQVFPAPGNSRVGRSLPELGASNVCAQHLMRLPNQRMRWSRLQSGRVASCPCLRMIPSVWKYHLPGQSYLVLVDGFNFYLAN